MPLPLSRFMNVFNENSNIKNNNNNNEFHTIHQQQQFHHTDDENENDNNSVENVFMHKRGGVRLCGVRLLKKMSAVCNNCIKSPDSSAITKRARPADMSQFAAYCCSTGCAEDDFKQFCC
uniref:Insulin-like domain-containing protein n=1 Tax=Panagrolaimus sp. PS1159 TaxID=55785 RepID=A0AC35FJX6_9BILA